MINVERLSFTYPGGKQPAVRNITLSVNDGEIVGFLGPSGSGKSTLQKILIGVLKNYEGSVQIMGQESKKSGAAFNESLGVAFEIPNFYQRFTAEENLKFFLSFYKNKGMPVVSLLTQLGLGDCGSKRVSEFSKGMKMRLNICRAFLHNPDIVFLDEPTAGLDPVNVKKVVDFILRQKKTGKTIIITTHNMHVAQAVCDRVGFIVDGELKLVNTPEALVEKHSDKAVKVEYTSGTIRCVKRFPLQGIGENSHFREILTGGNIVRLETEEKTLEDIFIEVTGRELE
ncbi:ABC transporter ATP-binding protein [Alteribacter keqinensis]|uniref:ABC transporter ATP-binding protein n=1 Tax=Alteribacter keqinensis TaxID=2483800 RepID=A0A3M7TWJ9_9BACI|nr:ABC transporter ATP-binding protein [Alteribacter keqinensis]RNA69946.1 ABC transporter ATP-binding protein [Alteribacter keqinensis]